MAITFVICFWLGIGCKQDEVEFISNSIYAEQDIRDILWREMEVAGGWSGEGKNITTDILLKICRTLDCDIADIMEVTCESSIEGRQ